jgi:hypothetical protein
VTTKKELWCHMLILEEEKVERQADPPSPERDAWIQQCDEYLKEVHTKISPEEIEQLSAERKRQREQYSVNPRSNPACSKEYWLACNREK